LKPGPWLFRPKINSNTDEAQHTAAAASSDNSGGDMIFDNSDNESDGSINTTNGFDQHDVEVTIAKELKQLSQVVSAGPSSSFLRINNDDNRMTENDDTDIVSRTMIRRLDLVAQNGALDDSENNRNVSSVVDTALATTTTQTTITATSVSQQQPYLSVNRVGEVSDHDRPYAEFGHLGTYRLLTTDNNRLFSLDAQTIAQQNDFDLEGIENQKRRAENIKVRLEAKTWCVTCQSTIASKTGYFLRNIFI